jgi:NAD(P)-dependent dehydrogenase (short-subunit alcohol dehydrogenase family)
MSNERWETSEGSGLETVMTANHLSHFLLTNLLIGHLERTNGRVVVLSSALHNMPKAFDFDDIMSAKEGAYRYYLYYLYYLY